MIRYMAEPEKIYCPVAEETIPLSGVWEMMKSETMIRTATIYIFGILVTDWIR